MTKWLFSFPFRLPWNLPPFPSLIWLLLALTTSPSSILPGTLDWLLSQNCPWRSNEEARHKICQTAHFKLKCISSVCMLLTEDATKTLVIFYIPSRLDYSNCFLMGTPNSVIRPLQKIQNFAARLVLLAPHHQLSTPLPEKLHWLPISEHIKFKVTCMCFRAINFFWSCLPLWTVPYTTLFFWQLHAENPTIQMQDSWLLHLLLLWTPHFEFTPTRP